MTPPVEYEENHTLRFTIYVDTYGRKSKCVKDIGRTLGKILYIAFGNRFKLVDHRSQPVAYDPSAHDWGAGEA